MEWTANERIGDVFVSSVSIWKVDEVLFLFPVTTPEDSKLKLSTDQFLYACRVPGCTKSYNLAST